MASFDREAALKSAEKALRQGRVEVAIAEYARIVEAQPRDWNSANALGDLYVKSKQLDKGVEQYTRIADHLAGEGFLPKAAALYKKILKFKPDDEYALLQSAEIAAQQGLLADSKSAFKAVSDRRRSRGDSKGAAEIAIRVGTLDPDDLEARLAAARAALEIGKKSVALSEFREVAFKLARQGERNKSLSAFKAAFDLDPGDAEVRERLLDGHLEAGNLTAARAVAAEASQKKRVAAALEADGKTDDALDVLGEVAALDPADIDVLVKLAKSYVAKGDPERARSYFNPGTAGRNPDLWLTLADIELSTGRFEEGRAAVVKALDLDPSQREAALALGRQLSEQSADAGFPCLDAVADAALAAWDYSGAATALNDFVTRVPHHIVALMRLVEICVDGGLDTTLHDAQSRLADAYLASERALEARIISEDLVAREPWNTANIDRFRRALVMLGETDPDSIIAERLSGESPFLATDKMDLNEGVFFEEASKPPAPPPAPAPLPPPPPEPAKVAAPAPPPAPAPSEDDEVIDLDSVLDLESVLLDEPDQPSPPVTARPAKPVVPTQAAAKLAGKASSNPVAPPAEARKAALPAQSLDDVFEQTRDEVENGSEEEAAAEQYSLAVTYRELGMADDAIEALKGAARSPRQRFPAASLLGTLYLERDEIQSAIEWFERAAEAPAPTPDAGRALLYDLASTLEKAGALSRSLAVFVELEAESGAYRDVAYRILRLSKLQTKE